MSFFTESYCAKMCLHLFHTYATYLLTHIHTYSYGTFAHDVETYAGRFAIVTYMHICFLTMMIGYPTHMCIDRFPYLLAFFLALSSKFWHGTSALARLVHTPLPVISSCIPIIADYQPVAPEPFPTLWYASSTQYCSKNLHSKVSYDSWFVL